MTKAPVDNWHLDFNYHGDGIDCDISMAGSAAALAVGLNLATVMVQIRMQGLLSSGNAPPPLFLDAMILAEVLKGNVKDYKGEYLSITRLSRKAKGLSTSITIQWND